MSPDAIQAVNTLGSTTWALFFLLFNSSTSALPSNKSGSQNNGSKNQTHDLSMKKY